MGVKGINGDGLHEADGDPLKGSILDAKLAMGVEASRSDVQGDVVQKTGACRNSGRSDVFDEGSGLEKLSVWKMNVDDGRRVNLYSTSVEWTWTEKSVSLIICRKTLSKTGRVFVLRRK
jgi:hypothetical protein